MKNTPKIKNYNDKVYTDFEDNNYQKIMNIVHIDL